VNPRRSFSKPKLNSLISFMNKLLLLLAAALAVALPALAGNLTYSTLIPQTTDTELVITHKQAVAIANMATSIASGTNALVLSGTTFTVVGTQNVALTGTSVVSVAGRAAVETTFSVANISTSGTTAVSSAAGVLRSITLNTAGTASQAVVKDGATTIATLVTTGTPVTLTYDATIATGINVITTGSPAANLTISYR
jgi:hypothetical protein